MFKNHFFYRRTVIINWVLSYALIISVPLIIAGLTYMESQSVIRKEINQSNTFLLKRLQQRMDSVLNDIRKLEVQIIFDEQINDILLSGQEISDIQRYKISKVVENLKTYKLSYNSISEFFLYFKDLDLIISNTTSTNSKTYYFSYNRYENKGYENWLKLLQAKYSGTFITQSSGNSERYKRKKITYIKSIPVISKTFFKVNLVIMFDDEMFLKEAEGIKTIQKGTVLILNNNNTIIASTEFIDHKLKLNYKEFSGTEGILNKSYNGREFVVSYIDSDVTGWKYVSLIPTEVFWEKANYIRVLSTKGLLICLFIGCILAFFLTKKNYSPLNKLIRSFQNQLEPLYTKNYNEYSYLQQAINQMIENKKELGCRLDQQNRILKTEFISRLLKGREEIGISLNDLLLSYNIKFETKYFAVMIFYIKGLDLSYEEGKETGYVQTEAEVFKLIQLMVINVVEELIGQNNNRFITEIDDLLVCLINFKEEGLTNWEGELRRVSSEIRNVIGRFYKICFLISISNIHETIVGIPEAYREALQTMEYMRVMGVDEDTFFGEINQLPKADYYFPLEKEYQLINRIKAGESIIAQNLLEDLFSKNQAYSIQFTRWFILDISSTIIKAANDLDDIKRDDILKELSFIDTLINSKSMNEIKEMIKHIIDRICRIIQEKKTTSHIKVKVMEYVEKNYNDINLSVAKIASSFNMHPVYISGEFKKLSGIGLLDYIHRIRIEKAKEILKAQKDNLEGIAHKVGYANVRTFSRLFIRYEGITPGKFREKN